MKPECEKNGWEKFCDGCKSAIDWCKDNWEYICACVVAVIVVVAIVALCIVTFEGAAVFLTAIVGGVLLLTGNPALACAVDSSISTLFTGSLEAFTGGERLSMGEILLDTTVSAGTAFVFSKLFGKLSEKLAKSFSESLPALRRLSGRGSYASSFKGAITRLRRSSYKNFTIKSIRNGVVDGLAGSMIENIVDGFGFNDLVSTGIKGIITGSKTTPNAITITMPKITPIPQINFLPIRSY